MTAVHIDIIHGDRFIREPGREAIRASEIVSPVVAASAIPGATSVRLSWFMGRPMYVVENSRGERLVNARDGAVLPRPSKTQIGEAAKRWYVGGEELARLSLINEIPGEVRGQKPPIWRADFGGWNKPTLYLSPATGELISRRHELWRVFDFVWMLHIMDYGERENVNNWLLRAFTWLGLTMALSGAWLLWHAFPRRRRKAVRR